MLLSQFLDREFILQSEAESTELAQQLAQQVTKGTVLSFNGELGSGKTFFCRQIIRALCGAQTQVISPTFNLLQTYLGPGFEIYHFDLYRLKNAEEIYELGLEDALEQVCLIEWPSIIAHLLPKDAILINLSIINNKTRMMRVSC